jgi:hypothetical protein
MIPATSGENVPGSIATDPPSFSTTTQACSYLVNFTARDLLFTRAARGPVVDD